METPPEDPFVSEVDLVDEFTRVSYTSPPPGGPAGPGAPGGATVGVVMATVNLPTSDDVTTAWSAAACSPPPVVIVVDTSALREHRNVTRPISRLEASF